MKQSIYTLLLVMAGSWVSAQPLDETPIYMMIETAEASLEIPDYYTALEWYENAYKETRDPDIAVKIAYLQIKLRDYSRAERWLTRIVEKDQGEQYPMTVFEYAKVLKVNGKYQESIDAFNFFAGLNVSDSLLTLADNEVAGIQLAVKSNPPMDLVVENVGKNINYSYTDASPWLGPDGILYFSSMRTRELITLDGKEGDYYLKLYTSEADEDGEWEKAKPMSSKINREGYHTGNPSISPDGSRMFFTRSELEGNDLAFSTIFVSVAQGQNWGAPNEITGINGNYVAKQPAPGVLFGKEVLFFSSNMPGGFGGYDLYYADRIDDQTYSIPVNLGQIVNSAGDEETPFYLDGNLYFSSTGHPGLGGFDVFRSEWNGKVWSTPANLGAGYNSSYDDLYFSVNEEGKLGFLVSNRPAEGSRSMKSKTCCDDIYQFHIREVLIDLIASAYDGTTPLTGATVTVYEMDNGRTGKSQKKTEMESNEFQFALDPDKYYKVLMEREGFLPAEAEFNTMGVIESKTLTWAPKLTPKEDDSVMETVTINEPIRLNNIYYDFDDDKILPDAEKDLTFLLNLMKEYPDMVIELSSHTDAQGNDDYNERLSQRRAQSAKNWLVRNGISEKRIEAVGYGEQNILNDCINGINCTDDEHRVNRRTEFKIIAGPTTIEIRKSDLGDQKKKTVNPETLKNAKGTVLVSDPKISLLFDKKLVELGRVRKGDKRSMSYSFTNMGNVPIEIELVSSCECTTLDWPQFKVFKPGDTGIINAVFDSTEKEIGETTDIEIILKQTDPKTNAPIIYVVQYSFDLVK